MRKVSWSWQSPDHRMEIHHNEVNDEYTLMCGSGNVYEFRTETVYEKILSNQGDAEALGQDFLKSYGKPSWAITQ